MLTTQDELTTRSDGRVAQGSFAARGARPREAMLAHERIAERAYRIWEAAGRPDGRDWEHWFQAERELCTSPFAARTPPH